MLIHPQKLGLAYIWLMSAELKLSDCRLTTNNSTITIMYHCHCQGVKYTTGNTSRLPCPSKVSDRFGKYKKVSSNWGCILNHISSSSIVCVSIDRMFDWDSNVSSRSVDTFLTWNGTTRTQPSKVLSRVCVPIAETRSWRFHCRINIQQDLIDSNHPLT
jgi:hypothetical protein